MELRDIEYFSIIARHRHLGRAADETGLSQSALSKCLRRLEREVGAKLVRRTPKGVDLTAEGQTLLSHVHRLRTSLDDVLREVADVKRGLAGHIRIGVGAGYFYSVIPAACCALAKEAPKVSMRFRHTGPRESLHALRSGELDLAVRLMQPSVDSDIVQERLYDDRFVVVASDSHRLVGKRPLKLADLRDERWIVSAPTSAISRQFHSVFEKYGLPPPLVAVETDSPALRLAVVTNSELLGYTMASVARIAAPDPRFVELPVRELSAPFTIGVVFRKSAYLSPVALRFIEHLKAAAKHVDETSAIRRLARPRKP